MAENTWKLLQEVQDGVANGDAFPPRMVFAIAERVDEVMSSPKRAPVVVLEKQLTSLLDVLIKVAPEGARAAVFNEVDHRDAASVAFQLGQINFAQILSAHISQKRVDDGFASTVGDIRFRSYIDALRREDLSGKQLSEICAECVETVSRKLRQLRELGVTDFRREGTSFLNFLTPAARTIVDQLKNEKAPEHSKMQANIAKLETFIMKTPENMRRAPNFAIRVAGS